MTRFLHMTLDAAMHVIACIALYQWDPRFAMAYIGTAIGYMNFRLIEVKTELKEEKSLSEDRRAFIETLLDSKGL